MALMKREPFTEIDSMRKYMDRMFEQMMGGNLGLMGGRGMFGMPMLESNRMFSPNIEVYTTDKEVVLKAELPGLDAKDVNVEVTEDAVHLNGELKREEEIKEDNYFRTERQYGMFERIIPLPNRVRDADAKATFKNGVLTIRAPLAEEVKKPQARKLRIES